MAITQFDIDLQIHKFVAEFNSAEAPYFGVNIVEVNAENWDKFVAMTPEIFESTESSLGGKLSHYSVRDYGNRKRVLFIFYYAKSIGDIQSYDGYAIPEVRAFWNKYCSYIETYEWFLQSEVKDGAPST